MSIRPKPRRGSRSTPRGGVRAAPDWPAVSRALERWFPRAARDLPWRRRRSGYTALVSEIMLQQTQVDRVVPAFERFIARFPGIRALAAAPEQEVLAAWQGLGYYRRARLLHAAARDIVAHHGGSVPADAEELRALPGVGRYTAGAISSIAFGAREPIVDGNVFRVLARLAGRRAPATDGAAMRATWREAEALVRAARIPGVANEALMELGATVCTPAAPRCAECPLRRMCRARATGAPQAIPAAKPRAERTTVHWHALVVVRRGAVLLEPRGERGLWARMWQVPTIEDAAPLAPAALATRWGVPCRRVAEFEHATTHRRLRFSVHVPSSPARGRAGTPDPSARATSARWVALSRIAEYPLANAMRRVLAAAGAEVSPPLVAAASPRTRRGSPSAATDS